VKIFVLYHANCQDGFGAAWVARQYYGQLENVRYVPMNYGQPIPDEVDDAIVYLLDFSFKRPQMRELIERAHYVVVLDHHTTAQDELRSLEDEISVLDKGVTPLIVFDMDKSGMRLAWDHFFPGKDRPWIVDYVEDRDLWRHALPKSEYINAALRSYPQDFDVWRGLSYSDSLRDLEYEGMAIRRTELQMVEVHKRQVRYRNIAGHAVPVVNASVLFSEIAGDLAVGYPFAACYFDRADGVRQWSLRSAPDGMDVSVIAKQYGGGGHKHAAGFQTPAPDLMEMG
jgi:oligoribonuclease NrnB/cAMP/cGMP phosphodiesterase (DHH superfamily)